MLQLQFGNISEQSLSFSENLEWIDRHFIDVKEKIVILTHSSSAAPAPSSPASAPTVSALLAMILSVHDAPACLSPAKLHFVTVPLSTLAKETVGDGTLVYQPVWWRQVQKRDFWTVN